LIFKDDVGLIETFRRSNVKYIETPRGFYLRRAHVVLKIDGRADFPQTMLETLFWLRWAGSFNSQTLRESVLVVGPTGCKTEALRFIHSSQCQERTLSRETQVSELIGSCVLRSPASSNRDVAVLADEVKTALENYKIILKKERIEDLIESVELMLKSDHKNEDYMLKGALFMFLGVQKMQMKHQSVEDNDNFVHGVHVLTSFVPGVVTRAVILGYPVLLRSIHLPSPSVFERLNSLLEEPPSLDLAEDTQGIFSDPETLHRISGHHVFTIPVSRKFSLSATTSEIGYLGLSGPLQSRFTYICSRGYVIGISHLPSFTSSLSSSSSEDENEEKNIDECPKLANIITNNNLVLVNMIQKLRVNLHKWNTKISLVEFVRWCRTASVLCNECHLQTHHATAIAALRTIADSLPSQHRGVIMQKAIIPFMEDYSNADVIAQLTYIVITDGKKYPKHECPLILDEENKQIVSKISGVSLHTLPNTSLKPLENIVWTSSAVDICDAVVTAVASRAVAIFEGSPGRGIFYY
jgi:hypothetical protein